MDKRQGFTLVELVVVVMILGILAAVAAPKLLGTSGTATDNGLRQTLAVVRDAIERYAAENGGKFPGTEPRRSRPTLAPYLRGTFPTCPVGNKNANVAVGTTSTRRRHRRLAVQQHHRRVHRQLNRHRQQRRRRSPTTPTSKPAADVCRAKDGRIC